VHRRGRGDRFDITAAYTNAVGISFTFELHPVGDAIVRRGRRLSDRRGGGVGRLCRVLASGQAPGHRWRVSRLRRELLPLLCFRTCYLAHRRVAGRSGRRGRDAVLGRSRVLGDFGRGRLVLCRIIELIPIARGDVLARLGEAQWACGRQNDGGSQGAGNAADPIDLHDSTPINRLCHFRRGHGRGRLRTNIRITANTVLERLANCSSENLWRDNP
jgi:hypothetical protein